MAQAIYGQIKQDNKGAYVPVPTIPSPYRASLHRAYISKWND